MRYTENILKRTVTHARNRLTLPAPRHIWGGNLWLGCFCGVLRNERLCEKVGFEDGDLCTPSNSGKVAIADRDGGAGLPEVVCVNFFEHADVPDGHAAVLACGDHVPAGAVNRKTSYRSVVWEEFDEWCRGVR
jgi:hypothetical protein